MIGEPEIDGSWGTASGAEVLPGEPAPERVRRARPPWLWALGGVVAASAVWAGTLAVQDRFRDTPRLDYRHSADVCKEFEVKTVGQAAGREFDGRQSSAGTSPEQDWAYCTTSMLYVEGAPMYGAQVLVELHKKTDPGREFATGPGTDPDTRLDTDERYAVVGLGERAVLDPYYGRTGARLMVLDGGAVFTLSVQWFHLNGDPGGGVDGGAMEAAMVEDMRALMAKLKR
ncbi:hypothetical protein [Streptomyces sp. TBY4]|uniref:hypothetical protein n=1 Tax=Streptomyces sp. TBY4 TaxID=2962030 RepID=UPI0020B803F1|nr:hypothetical protein [Streptomyces sp. TBY4]MCP3755692.1 hypothetical protein [Streptomyces sp. TBY4]